MGDVPTHLEDAQSSTVLRAQVVGSGKRIFTADPVAVDTFEMYALSDYVQLEREQREAVRAFADRYREG